MRSGLITSLCVSALVALGQEPPVAEPEDTDIQVETQEQRDEASAKRRGYRTEAGVAYAGMLIPRPISTDQFAHYADILQLSAAQRQTFRHLYESHLDTTWVHREKHLQPLLTRAAELSRLRREEGAGSVRVAQMNKELFHDRTKAVEPIFSAEAKLFADLAPFLTEQQIPLLDRARSQRTRDLCIEFIILRAPGINIDLAKQLWVMSQQRFDCGPVDHVQFQVDLLDYESLATRLLKQMHQIQKETWGTLPLLRAQVLEAANEYPDLAQARVELRASIQEVESLEEKRCSYHRPLHELNREYVHKLAQKLPEDTARALEKWFLEQCYPVVYPNPYDADAVISSTLGLENLDDDQQVLLNTVALEYREKRDSLSDQMVKRYVEWCELIEPRSRRFSQLEYESYQLFLDELQRERAKAAEEMIEVLFSVLDDSSIAKLRKELEQFEAGIKAFEQERKRQGRAGSWPGPFD